MVSVIDSKEDVIQLDRNLYRVRLDVVNFAEVEESDVLQFSNPRSILGDSSEGFSKEQMSELREAIRTEGLKNPLQLRWIEVDGENYLQVVDGERRTRSLKRLYDDNADCYDPADEETRPAQELYEYVYAYISNLDDKQAFKHAFSANESSVGIGDGATIALIRQFRNHSWTDEQILEVTGKSISWLRDTDILIGLDDDTFSAIVGNSINRSSALELARIEDLTERLEILEIARNKASLRIAAVKAKIEEDVSSTLDKIEDVKVDKIMAVHAGDKKGASKATEKLETLEQRVSKKKKLSAPDEKITSKDIQAAKASKKTGTSGAGERTSLTRAKIEKFWYEPIVAIIKTNGMDAEGNALDIDLIDVKLAKTLCDSIEKGDTDIVKILRTHMKHKQKR